MKAAERGERELQSLFATARYWPRGGFFTLASARRFTQAAASRVRPGDQVLDLGCGRSASYRPYIEALGARWRGADLHLGAPDSDPAYRQVINNHLAFDDRQFDAVMTFHVIEHFTDPEAMFAEVARMLKPGGHFSGAVAFWEMEHESFFHLTRLGVQELLKRHGFECLELQASTHTGPISLAQRFFGGDGLIVTGSLRLSLRSMILCNLNWMPFLVVSVLEALRRLVLRRRRNPFADCSTIYFHARRL
jgi:SAM-dependent methyltransferase